VLEIRELPVPAVREGWSLVQVKGAGLNRSELRTRQGHSPNVTFPRVLGIECVGIVAASTDPMLPDGTTVAAVMGEMGREFDGGYAEYALLPNSLLMPVTTTLPWDVLAALPETYLTAQGSLDALGVVPGGQGRLLIRGGTSSVGMAAASIASGYGVETAATTRRPGKTGALTAAGADYALVDDGESLAGPRSGPRRGEHGGGFAAPGPPGRHGVRDGLAQRMGDPRLRTGSDDPVRNQAHGFPQQ
jgi:NADPH:quinone reductase-like Zn-dependent oxidoreductase